MRLAWLCCVILFPSLALSTSPPVEVTTYRAHYLADDAWQPAAVDERSGLNTRVVCGAACAAEQNIA